MTQEQTPILQSKPMEPSQDSPEGHHTWMVNVVLKEEEAKLINSLQSLFHGIGGAYAADPRCPFAIGADLALFKPEAGVILPPNMGEVTHTFSFIIKLKSQIEKEKQGEVIGPDASAVQVGTGLPAECRRARVEDLI